MELNVSSWSNQTTKSTPLGPVAGPDQSVSKFIKSVWKKFTEVYQDCIKPDPLEEQHHWKPINSVSNSGAECALLELLPSAREARRTNEKQAPFNVLLNSSWRFPPVCHRFFLQIKWTNQDFPFLIRFKQERSKKWLNADWVRTMVLLAKALSDSGKDDHLLAFNVCLRIAAATPSEWWKKLSIRTLAKT